MNLYNELFHKLPKWILCYGVQRLATGFYMLIKYGDVIQSQNQECQVEWSHKRIMLLNKGGGGIKIKSQDLES